MWEQAQAEGSVVTVTVIVAIVTVTIMTVAIMIASVFGRSGAAECESQYANLRTSERRSGRVPVAAPIQLSVTSAASATAAVSGSGEGTPSESPSENVAAETTLTGVAEMVDHVSATMYHRSDTRVNALVSGLTTGRRCLVSGLTIGRTHLASGLTSGRM